jgi:hypothetical protein
LVAGVEELQHPTRLVSYLSALLFGSTLPTEAALQRRRLCFEAGIDFIRRGRLGEQGSREVVEVLRQYSRHLLRDQAIALIDRILGSGIEFVPFTSVADNESCAEGVGGDTNTTLVHLMEVLPQLAAVSSECAEYAISRLYEMTWPRGSVVTYTSALIELCTTEAECERAMTKVMAYLCGFSSCRTRAGAAPTAVEAEELPSLVHHLSALCRKVSGKSSVVPSLVHVLAAVLDGLTAPLLRGVADGGARPRPCSLPSRGERVPTGRDSDVEEEETVQCDDEADLVGFDLSLRARQMKQMQPVIATIVHHISVMVSRNQVTLFSSFL